MYWYGIQVMWFFIGGLLGFILAAILASGRESKET